MHLMGYDFAEVPCKMSQMPSAEHERLNPVPRVGMPSNVALTPRVRDSLGHQPNVLVLLAAYNGEKWILEQIKSILAQVEVNVHIVIRDDGSSDKTLDKISSLLNGDGRLTLMSTSEPTGSAAQNFLTLMRENSADGFNFVAFSDQDDIWHPKKLTRACEQLSNVRLAGYSGATIASWPNGRKSVLRQVHIVTNGDYLFEGAGQGCTYVLRAEFYREVRAFVIRHQAFTNKLHYHDWMVYALARSWEYGWVFDSQPLTSYRQHSLNDTGARSTWAGMTKRLRFISKGWYRSQLAAIAAICMTAAPGSPTVTAWKSQFLAKDSWARRLRIASFILRHGRRRTSDNVILILSALIGWI
jgi:rhamnosyltransferase